MVDARFSSPFAPLALSVDEKEQLVAMADTIVAETMAAYERFMWQDKGRLDPATWDRVREREDTRVYHRRRPSAGKDNNKDMHLLLTVGSVLGSLHDAMFGVLNPTIETMRIKTAYIGNTLIDTAVLESIVQPTPELPFESTVVRWAIKGVPLHVRLIARHQDAVYLEMTGMRQLANGERVGIHLMHSVAFTKALALPTYDRINVSLCTMWRQMSTDRVQCYTTSYFEIKDSFKTNLVIMAMADAVLSIWKIIECAQLKKLAWLVQNKRARSQSDASSCRESDETCSVCDSQHRSTRRGIKSACAVCAKYTCSKCRVKREISLFAPDGQLLKHKMRFCVPCITSTTYLDAATIAADEASGCNVRSGGRNYPVSFTMSSSSSSSSGDEMRRPMQQHTPRLASW